MLVWLGLGLGLAWRHLLHNLFELILKQFWWRRVAWWLRLLRLQNRTFRYRRRVRWWRWSRPPFRFQMLRKHLWRRITIYHLIHLCHWRLCHLWWWRLCHLCCYRLCHLCWRLCHLCCWRLCHLCCWRLCHCWNNRPWNSGPHHLWDMYWLALWGLLLWDKALHWSSSLQSIHVLRGAAAVTIFALWPS